ncbi:MAG: hypothetical protein IPI61_14935 [Syntrophaceae bacterium]|nr:hypothetical protein [Syntrophaceae bacterium]
MEKGRLEHAQYLIDKAISIDDKEEYRTPAGRSSRMKEKVAWIPPAALFLHVATYRDYRG